MRTFLAFWLILCLAHVALAVSTGTYWAACATGGAAILLATVLRVTRRDRTPS